ncbi:MAG: ketol-acid reductoisomerase [Candidatus Zixiibacteriota bacterium]
MKERQSKSANPATTVLGYGSQGRAIALNLRDSGWPVVVGLKKGSKSVVRARKEGMSKITSVADAVKQAKLVVMAIPDHLHGRVFEKEIAPNLKPGTTILFLSGMAVHFGFVRPPSNCDVIMLAPHAPGLALRERYLGDRSVSAFYAVHQNPSRKGWQTAVRFADAIGIKKSRLVKSTFAWEAVGDIFGEQAVLCGGLAGLIQAGFDTLVKGGIPSEHAYLEVAYQLDLIIDLVKRFGIEGMFNRISVAARYGSYLTGPKVIDAHVRKQMQKTLGEIKSGAFSKRLNRLGESDIRVLNKKIKSLSRPALERSARKYAGK